MTSSLGDLTEQSDFDTVRRARQQETTNILLLDVDKEVLQSSVCMVLVPKNTFNINFHSDFRLFLKLVDSTLSAFKYNFCVEVNLPKYSPNQPHSLNNTSATSPTVSLLNLFGLSNLGEWVKTFLCCLLGKIKVLRSILSELYVYSIVLLQPVWVTQGQRSVCSIWIFVCCPGCTVHLSRMRLGVFMRDDNSQFIFCKMIFL